MKRLFEPALVGGLPLRNRIIRSATHEYAFDNDKETFVATIRPLYEKLAGNGVAAIITGMVGVDGNSRILPSMIPAYGRAFVPEFGEVAKIVHGLGAKLIAQISHCGQKANQIDDGGPALGPSDAQNPQGKPVKAMSRDDIRSAVAAFAATAVRCKEAGMDAVQLHAAHGYLLSQFLSPYFNKRTDEYGGAIANRARIVFEVFDAVRAAVGDDYPIWIKINSMDLTEPSIAPEDFLWVCGELDKRGIDAIEVSGGAGVDARTTSAQVVRTEEEEGRFAGEALRVADTVSASVISVCGYRTPKMMGKWLNEGKIAAISLCRPLISEPDLVGRWESGEERKSRCICCNKCFTTRLVCTPFATGS